MIESSCRLATALAYRNQPGDAEKAIELINRSVSAGCIDRYVQEAVDALKQTTYDKAAIMALNDRFQQQQAINELFNSKNLLEPEQVEALCHDAKHFNGHDYKVFRVRLNWEKARIRCRELGGYLACITSPEENDFIVDQASQGFYSQPTCCWIGCKENDWGDFAKWVSGETVNMPDYIENGNPREKYLNLRLHSGRWEDYPNRGERVGEQWFVCEWPSENQENSELGDSTLAKCPNKRKLKDMIAQARKTVNVYGQGYVIVGQVVLDGEGDVREVNAQMEILSDGYFAGPVKDLIRPVGFRMHQYAPYDLELNHFKAAEVVDVGTIHMKPLEKDELQDFKAKIILEDGGDLSQIKVRLSVMNGPVNTPHNGTSPRSFWPQPIMLSAQEDGLVEGSDFSPIEYYCIINAPDYLKHTQPVKFTEGQTLNLGTITLEKPRPIRLSYIIAQEPPFDLSMRKNTTVPAGTRWKATDDVYGWDLEFNQEKGSIILNYSYGPCQLWDLGEGHLEDFVDIRNQSEGVHPHQYPVKNGHVYLINQGHWKRWILLKIETDDSIFALRN